MERVEAPFAASQSQTLASFPASSTRSVLKLSKLVLQLPRGSSDAPVSFRKVERLTVFPALSKPKKRILAFLWARPKGGKGIDRIERRIVKI